MFENYNEEGRKVFNDARRVAIEFNHGYIGTEHVLLVLISDEYLDSAEVLKAIGVDLEGMRAEVRTLVQSGPESEKPASKLPFTPRLKKVLDLAQAYASKFSESQIGTRELLIGLLLEQEGIAGQILERVGVTLERIESASAPGNSPGPRHDGRAPDQLREIRFTRGFTNAHGSVLVEFGQTRVLCTAMYEDALPPWKRQANIGKPEDERVGWLSAEYAMLPSSTNTRKQRDRNGKVDGRSVEIQRLIGRSLRAIIDLKQIGERTIWLDCDVLQADGGTRTASITGAYVALWDCLLRMKEDKKLKYWPLIDSVAAVSVGIVSDQPVLDLDYKEDVTAQTDMNVVMTGKGLFIEVQGTAEDRAFPREQLNALVDLAAAGIQQLTAKQKQALERDA